MKKVFLSFLSGVAIVGLTSTIAFAAEIVNPDGELLDERELSIPGDPIGTESAFSITDVDEYGGINDGTVRNLGGKAGCGLDQSGDGDHPFATDTITVTESGDFTFRIVNSTGVRDTFLALYEGEFDKENPDQGVVGCNDDAGWTDGDTFESADDGDPAASRLWSAFTAEELSEGTYTVLLTTHDNYATNVLWYDDGNGDDKDGDGDGVSGSRSTATFEYWGPEGGLGSSESSSSSPSKSTEETGDPGIFLTVTGQEGRTFEGSDVVFGSYAVAPNSSYQLVVESITDSSQVNRTLATGTVNGGGHIERTVTLPRLNAGSYKIVLTGTAATRQPLKLTNHVNVDTAGKFASVSSERLQPVLN